jgi:hypothetical protein
MHEPILGSHRERLNENGSSTIDDIIVDDIKI